MNNVALERDPVDLLVVQLNKSLVLCKASITGTDGNRRGVEDVSQYALVLYAPEPRDLTVKLAQCLYRLLRLPQVVSIIVPPISYHNVLTFNGLPKTLKLIFIVVDHDSHVPNLDHDGLKCAVVGLVAEEDDLTTRRVVSLAGVELVTIFARRENNMAGRKEETPIAFTAFAEVETTSTFEVRVGFGSDLETESGSEWAACVGGWVDGGDVFEELRTSEPGEDRFAKCYLNAGDLRLCENLLAVHGRVLGVLARESPGHHTHPKKKGTGFLSDLSKADRVNACPPEANGIEILVDLLTYFAPYARDRVVADRSSLLRHALGLGASGPWPRVPCVVDGDRVGWQTIVVRVGCIIQVRAYGRVKRICNILCEINICNHGGGGRERSSVSLSDDNALVDELLFVLEIYWNERAK